MKIIGTVTDPGGSKWLGGVVTVGVTDDRNIEVSIENDDGSRASVVLTVDLGPNSASSLAHHLLGAERVVGESMG